MILSPCVALVLGDARAGIVRRSPLALVLGDAYVVAWLAREEFEPAAIALLATRSARPPPPLP